VLYLISPQEEKAINNLVNHAQGAGKCMHSCLTHNNHSPEIAFIILEAGHQTRGKVRLCNDFPLFAPASASNRKGYWK
jgi:hypothetical protein